ncbi:MAG: hypothetical protein FJ149_13125, partial [Euryarchaeota archaeon]|nr:hypothetical protein [Euryarchaeota archaeon]
MTRRAAPALVAAVLLLAAGPWQAGGEVRTVFEDGTGQQLLVFPPGGGVNSTSVAIPAGMEVLNATVDLEGR